MLRNYFTVSFRGLMKNPVNSFINIFGLAIAIGICVFAYAFARWTYNTDQFHEHKHEVYMITSFANRDGLPQQYGFTPRPLGEILRNDFTQVKKICRVDDHNVIVKYNDNVFHERVRYTDPEFLEMFTFPLKAGTPASLKDINSIILSEEMAIKYFGDDDPLGRDILLKFDETTAKAFKVTGVADKFPDARTIGFDFLANFENLRISDPGYDYHDWKESVSATFIQVADSSSLTSVQQGMEKYRLMQNKAAEEDWAITAFSFEPLATLHERSSSIRDDISLSSDSKYQSIIFISIISAFMLALSCFNYINIAIVSAAKRLKEIGVRKTIGATRSVITIQFLTENIVVTFFALIAGLLLGTFMFIPWLESTADIHLAFTWNDLNLWMYLPAILLLTGIASGIYPSLYISGFQVAGILKGSVSFGKKNPLTKTFLGIQLVLACILITAGVMFSQNTDYMKKRSWGYNQHEVLYVAVPDDQAFEKIHARVLQEPDALSVSGSRHHLGRTHAKTVLHMPDRQMEVDELSVDANYLKTMGLSIAEGRTFREDSESDNQSVLVNQSFAAALGNAVGQTFRIDSVQYEIVGVAKDFHSYSFFRKVNPTIFTLADQEEYRYLSVRVRPGAEHKMAKTLKAHWSQLYPDVPFDGGFQEDAWGNYFLQLNTHAKVWKAFATVAVVLASLGLYGLIMLNVAGRLKEFSIRKILGAQLKNIAINITGQYVPLFILALGLGAPVSYFLNKMLFDTIYWYHMPVTYSGVIVAIIILILVLLITVSTQIRKILKSNPVNGLKEE